MSSKSDRFPLGDYNVICDYSGFKVRASECRRTWDGYYVHKKYWEPRHPQDFVRGRVDRQTVEIARPEQEDRFITSADISPEDL